jgi:hypothetical protein
MFADLLKELFNFINHPWPVLIDNLDCHALII